jgi:hypothetical protein
MLVEDLSSSLYVVCIQIVTRFLYIALHFSFEGGAGGGNPLAPSLGNSWRTTTDIQDYWSSMLANIDHVRLYYILLILLPLCISRTVTVLQLQVQVVGMIPIVNSFFFLLYQI